MVTAVALNGNTVVGNFSPQTASTNPIRDAAAELIVHGIAVCLIEPGEKRPVYGGWSTYCRPITDFTARHNVGIIGGPLSAPPGYSLVCIDLDSPEAVAWADEYLPPTGMIDGRPGKPRSHRWYLIRNDSIPEWLQSRASQAAPAAVAKCGHPGPRTIGFNGPDKKRAIDFKATGGQTVVPPSIWTSPDGSRTEPREWEGGRRGEPAAVDCMDLWLAVCKLAQAIGCKLPKVGPAAEAAKPKREKAPTAGESADPHGDDRPDDEDDEGPTWEPGEESPYVLTDPARRAEAVRRMRAEMRYIGLNDPPRTGRGGDAQTFRILARAIFDWGCSRAEATSAFADEVNARLVTLNDAWDAAEIERKVDLALARGPLPGCVVGYLLDSRPDDPPAPWDDPDRLGREFMKGRPTVAIKNVKFVYLDGAYKAVSDDWLDAEIRKHCLRAAAAELDRMRERHAAETEHYARECERLSGLLKEAALNHPSRAEWVAARKTAAGRLVKLKDRGPPAVAPTVTISLVREVVAAVASQGRLGDDVEPFAWINGAAGGRCLPVANGLLDLTTFNLVPPTANYFALVKLPVAFDPAAAAPVKWQAFVREVLEGDEELIALLQEVVGACLDPWSRIKFFAALVGGGDNGKSVVLAVLAAVLGAENTSAVTIDRLASERFAAWEMFGKLANLAGDQGHFESKDEGRLKTFTGGDRVTFERKGKDTITVVNTAKIVFACNTLPTFADKSDAVWNRSLPIPFNWTVPADRKNPALLTAAYWQDELPGILNWMIDGLKRLRANKGFTRSAAVDAMKGEHRQQSDPVRLFFAEQVEAGKLVADPKGFLSNDEIKGLYTTYQSWAPSSGLTRPLTRFTFGTSIGRCFPDAKNTTTTDGGKSVRGWRGVRLAKGDGAGTTGTTPGPRGPRRDHGRDGQPVVPAAERKPCFT